MNQIEINWQLYLFIAKSQKSKHMDGHLRYSQLI